MRKKKSFNWFALIMLMVIGYFLTVLTTQQLHLSHVSESQYLANKRLEAAKHENDKLRKHQWTREAGRTAVSGGGALILARRINQFCPLRLETL